MDAKNLIIKFISQISSEYPLLHIEYDYITDQDEHIIWHNDSELEFNDNSFKSFIAKSAEEYLFNNKIYNFSFGYDHFKAKELKEKTKIYSFNLSSVANVEYNCSSNLEASKYAFNLGGIKEQHISMEDLEISQSIGSVNRNDEYVVSNKSYSVESTIYKNTSFKEAA